MSLWLWKFTVIEPIARQWWYWSETSFNWSRCVVHHMHQHSSTLCEWPLVLDHILYMIWAVLSYDFGMAYHWNGVSVRYASLISVISKLRRGCDINCVLLEAFSAEKLYGAHSDGSLWDSFNFKWLNWSGCEPDQVHVCGHMSIVWHDWPA
jgi:hypothetical protein